jgi:integrase
MTKIPGIYLRGNTYWLRYSHQGRQRFVSLKTTDLSEALRLAAENRKNPVSKSQLTVSDLIEPFLLYKLTKARKRYGTHTVHSKKYALRMLAAYFEGKPISSISGRDMQTFYEMTKDRTCNETARTYILSAQAFFRWCVEIKRLILSNPCLDVVMEPQEIASRKKFCESELMHRLLDKCRDPQLKFILYCGFHGMRFNEIVEAVPRWFDLQRKEIHIEETPHFIPKNKKRRTIPLTDKFLKFLSSYPLDGKYCIAPTVERGRAKYRYDFTRPFRLYMKSQDCRWVTPHVLRHTFTTLLYFANTPLIKISQWSGDTVRVLERHYIHEVAGDREINKLMQRPKKLRRSSKKSAALQAA